MKPTLKYKFELIGLLLSLVGVFFAVSKLYHNYSQLSYGVISINGWLTLGGCVVVYAMSCNLLAFAWRQLLNYLGQVIPIPVAINIYGRSQLSKYIPGNIFHLATRQLLGAAAGLTNGILARSMVIELCLLLLSGLLFLWLILPQFISEITDRMMLILFFISVIAVRFVLKIMFSSTVTKAFDRQLTFFIISGLLFSILIYSVAGVVDTANIIVIVGSYVAAWLVGFMLPGSPAGLGIREVALWYLLRGIVNDADLSLVIMLWRFTTLIGDGLFYTQASFLKQGNIQYAASE